MRHAYHRRPAFTLVELLVVVTLVLIITGITVLFLANFRGSAGSQGTQQLYGYLNMARQSSTRDRTTYGLRLLPGSGGAQMVDQLQYIEQPEDYSIPNSTFIAIAPGYNQQLDQQLQQQQWLPPNGNPPTLFLALFNNADFTGGYTITDQNLWPVQPGDYVVLNDSGKAHRIASKALGDAIDGVCYSGNPNNLDVGGLVLVSRPDLPTPSSGCWQYRIQRKPRVVGEDTLRLPQGVVIDLQPTGSSYTPPAAPFDILFGPKGTIIGPMAAFDKIILWVRETSGTAMDNDPNLVVINTRSGSIATYRVDTTGTDVYSETRTGQTSPQ
jgi:prepilin-type N-terminal cleavage/methylation domain-containing protein